MLTETLVDTDLISELFMNFYLFIFMSFNLLICERLIVPKNGVKIFARVFANLCKALPITVMRVYFGMTGL